MDSRVYVNTPMDLKTRLKSWCSDVRVKQALQHMGLFITLMAYTVVGGVVFRCLEHPAEIERISRLRSSLLHSRRHLAERIINNTLGLQEPLEYVYFELKEYEKVLEDAFAEGFQSTHHLDKYESEKWSFLTSVFFSSTVLTTIGYGNTVPVTTEGRAFCIVFALVGIPLTLTVIADMGRLFATSLSAFTERMPGWCRHATIMRRTSCYAVGSVAFLFVYLSAGAGFFVIWEEDWTFFEGFYFCFITMTTIGFGDLVPKKPKYMLLCTIYILIGLALTSTIIELVRRQYLQSWKQLQAMSGPLADTLRKMADSAPGIDVSAFQNDLKKVLTVVTMPKRLANQLDRYGKKQKQIRWEEAVESVIRDISNGTQQKQPSPPVVKIVIYESSV
ncbi:hypothetical protein RN001_002935 [Aquatica leii]|uniref:Potassium channel domain-containing protein n=1 Tax=Aquatica leii TaxID=1421715 RepID=A0AAN7SM24_9COLE|nr:hypothetical protein RN001_002935 [Aquatica leii]